MVGDAEGDGLGGSEGDAEGGALGVALGDGEGGLLGVALGEGEGFAEGLGEGCSEGEGDGSAVSKLPTSRTSLDQYDSSSKFTSTGSTAAPRKGEFVANKAARKVADVVNRFIFGIVRLLPWSQALSVWTTNFVLGKILWALMRNANPSSITFFPTSDVASRQQVMWIAAGTTGAT